MMSGPKAAPEEPCEGESEPSEIYIFKNPQTRSGVCTKGRDSAWDENSHPLQPGRPKVIPDMSIAINSYQM